MPVFRTPQSKLDRVQKLFAEMRREKPEALLANMEAATSEHDIHLLQYRKRKFRVPPTPYREGLWLLGLDQELRRLSKSESTPADVEQAVRVVFEIVTIFHALVRPYTLFDRLFWRWRTNPFLHAEMHEINALRNFFCSARTTLPVRATPMTIKPMFLRRTWPMQKRKLLLGSLVGSMRMETLVAGDTSLSGQAQ
jgi:hypothetical protein